MAKKILWLSVFLCLLQLNALLASEWVAGVIHVHTRVSGGIFSIEEIAEKARNKGIRVVIVTDSAVKNAEYGPVPFLRGIIKKKIELNSVLKYGAQKYLKDIENANRSMPGILIIPGTEVSPFYYWEGSWFKKDLVMHNWHKNILVVGMEDPLDYKGMPLVSNAKSRFDQYHGDQGSRPYQDLIDYVNEKGALAFWSAPEVAMQTAYSGINVITPSFGRELLNTRGYFGFACFAEGYREIGRPGGIWDEILQEYCLGRRNRPVWTIGEVDYHYSGKSEKEIDSIQTVFYIPDADRGAVSKRAVLAALRRGNMYALWKTGEYGLALSGLEMKTGDKDIIMGQQVKYEGPIRMEFRVVSSDGGARPVKVRVIKNGKVAKKAEGITPLKISFWDAGIEKGKKTYYRFDIEGLYPHRIFTNPVFVTTD